MQTKQIKPKEGLALILAILAGIGGMICTFIVAMKFANLTDIQETVASAVSGIILGVATLLTAGPSASEKIRKSGKIAILAVAAIYIAIIAKHYTGSTTSGITITLYILVTAHLLLHKKTMLWGISFICAPLFVHFLEISQKIEHATQNEFWLKIWELRKWIGLGLIATGLILVARKKHIRIWPIILVSLITTATLTLANVSVGEALEVMRNNFSEIIRYTALSLLFTVMSCLALLIYLQLAPEKSRAYLKKEAGWVPQPLLKIAFFLAELPASELPKTQKIQIGEFYRLSFGVLAILPFIAALAALLISTLLRKFEWDILYLNYWISTHPLRFAGFIMLYTCIIELLSLKKEGFSQDIAGFLLISAVGSPIVLILLKLWNEWCKLQTPARAATAIGVIITFTLITNFFAWRKRK